jgi:phosphoglycolate phosphatase-like HAD superfamily hydrolase
MPLLLFDIDGTLVLTGGAGGRAMTRAFRDVFGVDDAFRGIPMPGRTDPLIVADAVTRAGVTADPTRLEAFRTRYHACLREEIAYDGRGRKGVMPGIRALLDALAARDDVLLALLTGNYTEAARIKLEYFGLWRYFACGAFGEEAPARNDLVPIALARALACGGSADRLGRVVVIGDTPLDVACAHSAGALAVGVATGGHSAEELAQAGAHEVFEDLSETSRFLALLET